MNDHTAERDDHAARDDDADVRRVDTATRNDDTEAHRDDRAARRNGTDRSASEETCRYTFDPTRETDAHLQATWECPHEAHEGSDRCPFHMSADERSALDVAPTDLVDLLKENLESDSSRRNEYVGADLPRLTLTYQDLNGESNHVLNLQHASIEGIDITHGRLDQGLNLRDATVGTLKFEDAVATGAVTAREATVDRLVTREATFQQDVDFRGVTFRGEVNCDEATFEEDTSFEAATFRDTAHFRNVRTRGTSHALEDHISFADAEFRDDASFREANFAYVTFEGATFHAASDFEHASFAGDALFRGVVFHRTADFDEAQFDDDASFDDVRFAALAEFRGVTFNGGSRATHDDVSFEGAAFEGEADFKLARFRYADFKDATFADDLNFDRATFDARADLHRIEVAGATILDRATFRDRVEATGSGFAGEVVAVGAEFVGDAEFDEVAFEAPTRFDEARFRADARFRNSRFDGECAFRGTVFEGEAKHLEENASFEEATFGDVANFESVSFTNASFRDATFHDECNFRRAEFLDTAAFRLLTGQADTYVDLTDATINGGTVTEVGGNPVPYDLTRATVGDVQLEGEGSEYELLDYFRFCLTDFDHFDFSNHHGYLERNDWNLHDFIGDGTIDPPVVEMTNEVIEETYRKAQDSADAVGDTPAYREFEFKRYFYNRKKNLDILLHEYSLDAWGKIKKGASVALNSFMQVTCGYGNRLPRIAAFTFLLPLLFGVVYVMGGPFETQAGVIWESADPLGTLFDGMYYSYISFSTVGYGDINPIGPAAKLLAMSQGMLNGLFFTLLTFTLFKRVLGGN